VRVPAGATVRGIAVDLHGMPIAGMKLVREGVRILGLQVPSDTVTTDGAGRFEFRGLTAAGYWIHGWHALPDGSLLPLARAVDVEPARNNEVRLAPTGTGSLRLALSTEGNGLPQNMNINVWQPDAPSRARFSEFIPSSTTLLRGLPAGDYRVDLHSANRKLIWFGHATTSITEGAESEVGVTLQSRPQPR